LALRIFLQKPGIFEVGTKLLRAGYFHDLIYPVADVISIYTLQQVFQGLHATAGISRFTRYSGYFKVYTL
ncbi:hypothetical protein ACI7MJ_01495, partial [Aeromonas caviae]|uniref:hypothetical protein n=1 Tax=Aeromonas caviae TaxID=648 RepID=UPI0038588C41